MKLKADILLEHQLLKLKLPFYKSFANFVLIDLGSRKRAEKTALKLKERKILVKAGFKPKPLDRCIRVNIGSRQH